MKKRALPIAFIALVLSVSASFAVPPEAFVENATSTIDQDGLSQYTLTDPARVTGGAPNQSCSGTFVTGAMLMTAGQVFGYPILTAIGAHLIYISGSVCM